MKIKKRSSPPISIIATAFKRLQPSAAQRPPEDTSEVTDGGGTTLICEPVTPATTTSHTALPPKPMSKEELLNRAKANIEFGELSYRERHIAAADDIAVVYDDGRGATQREIGRSLGKSGAWVNRILAWRREGYVGLPFAIEPVQDLNNDADSDTPISATTMPAISWTEPVVVSAPETDPADAMEEEETVPRKAPPDNNISDIKYEESGSIATSDFAPADSKEKQRSDLIETFEFLYKTPSPTSGFGIERGKASSEAGAYLGSTSFQRAT